MSVYSNAQSFYTRSLTWCDDVHSVAIEPCKLTPILRRTRGLYDRCRSDLRFQPEMSALQEIRRSIYRKYMHFYFNDTCSKSTQVSDQHDMLDLLRWRWARLPRPLPLSTLSRVSYVVVQSLHLNHIIGMGSSSQWWQLSPAARLTLPRR
jgi:hypothetical protein